MAKFIFKMAGILSIKEKLEEQAKVEYGLEIARLREPERMRKLLQGSANLEFWETYNNQEINPYLTQLDCSPGISPK